MHSKLVIDRVKVAESVVEALKQHAEHAPTKLDTVFKPYLKKGESMPDWAQVFRLVAAAIEHESNAMKTADAAHEAELADDKEPRTRRDQIATHVYAELYDIKRSVETLFGGAWVGKLRLPNELPRDPVVLSSTAHGFVSALDDAHLPKPRLKGLKHFDPKPWHDEITSDLKGLDVALADVRREAREAETTLAAKNTAINAHDAVFRSGASLSAALLHMAGDHDAADRLKPSKRHPGNLASSEPTPPTPSPSPTNEGKTT